MQAIATVISGGSGCILIALFVSSFDVVSLLLLKPCKKFLIKPMPMYSRHFLYSSPAQPLGPEDLMAGKVVNIKLHFRRSQRVVQGSRNVCTCECRPGNVTNTIPIVS
ncbi:Exostosin family protein [Arachis hypogaea]|nr:Exostosin family protein [Arachis hypogaea]